MEAAQDGDIVLVAAGTYSAATNDERFPLVLAGRRLTIRGAGAWRTILDAGGEARHFLCVAADSSTVEGMQLRGGQSADPGGAVRVENAATALRRIVIESCASATEGDAVALLSSQGSLTNVFFKLEDSGNPAVIVSGGAPRVEWCTFEGAPAEPIRVRGAKPHLAHNATIGAAGEFSGSEPVGAFAGSDPLERPLGEELAGDGAVPALLDPAIPNPFTPSTTIQFHVTDSAVVDLGVFNVLGQRIRTLFAGDRAAGEYRETWDGRDDEGRDMPPGVYYVRITQGRTTETQPLVLVR